MRKMKPKYAWAVVGPKFLYLDTLAPYRAAVVAYHRCREEGDRIVRVLITEAPATKKKRKAKKT